jgi:hypothetical protein
LTPILFAEADIMTGKMFSLAHIISFVLVVSSLIGALYFRNLITHVRTAIGVLLAGLAILTTWGGSRMYQSMQFDAQCRDYIVAAYKTDDKEKAKKYLTSALTYLKESGAHRGHSAVFAGGQTDDLGEYYADLSLIRAEMDEPATDTKVVSLSDGDPSNTRTEKVARKTYKDRLVELGFVEASDYKADMRYPSGMQLAPNNFMYFMWGLVGTFLTISGGGWTTASIVKRRLDRGKQICQNCQGTGCKTA